jgi:hypothetical protein
MKNETRLMQKSRSTPINKRLTMKFSTREAWRGGRGGTSSAAAGFEGREGDGGEARIAEDAGPTGGGFAVFPEATAGNRLAAQDGHTEGGGENHEQENDDP